MFWEPFRQIELPLKLAIGAILFSLGPLTILVFQFVQRLVAKQLVIEYSQADHFVPSLNGSGGEGKFVLSNISHFRDAENIQVKVVLLDGVSENTKTDAARHLANQFNGGHHALSVEKKKQPLTLKPREPVVVRVAKYTAGEKLLYLTEYDLLTGQDLPDRSVLAGEYLLTVIAFGSGTPAVTETFRLICSQDGFQFTRHHRPWWAIRLV